jgi:hypothetical protein
VECTWDKDEDAHRSRHLTNMSSWRHLHDSDLQQYLADSNSDDDTDQDADNNIDNNENKASKRKGMRQLLLGDGSDTGSDMERDDDFFNAGSDGGGSQEEGEGEGAMTFSFMPDSKEDLKAQDMKKRMEEGLVLFSLC